MRISKRAVYGALGALGLGGIGVSAVSVRYALTASPVPPGSKLITDYSGPREDSFVSSGDGTRIHVRSWGPVDGPLVVLIHGWACDVSNFPNQVEHLVDRGYRVVSYDQRGHGESEPGTADYSTDVLADDLHAVLKAASSAQAPRKTAVLIGHSMGAITIMAWAGRYPDEISTYAHQAVLVSTFVRDPVAQFVGATVLAPVAKALPKVSDWLGDSVLGSPISLRHNRLYGAVLRYTVLCAYASYAAVRYTENMVFRCPADVRSRWGHVLAATDVTEGLRALNIPTSVVVGQFDHLTPPSNSETVAGELRVSGHLDRYAVVRDAGHMLPIEQPEKLNALLDSILDRSVTAPT